MAEPNLTRRGVMAVSFITGRCARLLRAGRRRAGLVSAIMVAAGLLATWGVAAPAGAVTKPVAVKTTALPGATAGVSYSAKLAASGGVAPYTWSVTAGALPAGLTLVPATGLIAGIPAPGSSASFTVQASDSEDPSVSASAGLSITVTLIPLAVATVSLPAATGDVSYSAKLAASGGIAPYTWSVTVGALPAGLSLDPARGVISGRPTAPGTASFTVNVSDGESPPASSGGAPAPVPGGSSPASASAALSITVTVAPLVITTVSVLPGDTPGVPYSVKLAAAGGLTPYAWSITQGSLPAGLKLHAATGVISGTPTSGKGSGTFTAQVSDAENPPATASATFSLPAGVLAPAISTTSSAGGPVGSTTVTDAAILTGASSPTGTITFNLYGPSGTADCIGTPVDTETAAVAGNGSYATPTGYIPTATGTYWWTGSYGGDSGNNAVSSTCGDDQVVIGQATPVLGPWGEVAVQAGMPVHGEFSLMGGFNPTGTITFTLFGQQDCTDPVAGEPLGVSGDGNYTTEPTTPSVAGTYYWVATYSGDSSNIAFTSACSEEPVTVTKYVTTITTLAQPQEAPLDTLLADVATVAGGFDPTGAIQFLLYRAPNCQEPYDAGGIIGASVNGNGSYTSGPVAVPEAGTYYWVASYSGDSNNLAASSLGNDDYCNADPVEVIGP
jgi:Putative Ig domain